MKVPSGLSAIVSLVIGVALGDVRDQAALGVEDRHAPPVGADLAAFDLVVAGRMQAAAVAVGAGDVGLRVFGAERQHAEASVVGARVGIGVAAGGGGPGRPGADASLSSGCDPASTMYQLEPTPPISTMPMKSAQSAVLAR